MDEKKTVDSALTLLKLSHILEKVKMKKLGTQRNF